MNSPVRCILNPTPTRAIEIGDEYVWSVEETVSELPCLVYDPVDWVRRFVEVAETADTRPGVLTPDFVILFEDDPALPIDAMNVNGIDGTSVLVINLPFERWRVALDGAGFSFNSGEEAFLRAAFEAIPALIGGADISNFNGSLRHKVTASNDMVLRNAGRKLFTHRQMGSNWVYVAIYAASAATATTKFFADKVLLNQFDQLANQISPPREFEAATKVTVLLHGNEQSATGLQTTCENMTGTDPGTPGPISTGTVIFKMYA